jgi:type IV secretion system protein VirB9
MRLPFSILLAACLASGPASASVTPHPGTGDPHIQSVAYDPDQVVALQIAVNYALSVEFSPDEQIENVAVGNSAAWQVTADKSANRLFIKPTGGVSDTNLIVVTETRTYSFELHAAPAANSMLPFLVRFTYPTAPQAPLLPSTKPRETASYRLTGARDLRPAAMSDDGQATTITWSANAPVPAIFLLEQDGKEALANGGMRDGRYVVDGIAQRFVFRANGQVAYATRQVKKANEP